MSVCSRDTILALPSDMYVHVCSMNCATELNTQRCIFVSMTDMLDNILDYEI